MIFTLFEIGASRWSKSFQLALLAFRWGTAGQWAVFSVLFSRGYGTLLVVHFFGIELTYRVPYENSQNAG